MHARPDLAHADAGHGAPPRYACRLCHEPAIPIDEGVDACICGNVVVDAASGRVVSAATDTLLDRDATPDA